MTLQDRLNTAAARVEGDAATLRRIVHGAATETVETEGGPVKTAAHAIADLVARFGADSVLAQVLTAATEAGQSAQAAATSATEAEAAANSLNLPTIAAADAGKPLVVGPDGDALVLANSLDATTLEGQGGAFYRDLANATGTLAAERLSGTYGISVTGNAATASEATHAATANSASTAGNANTLEGYHASAFALADSVSSVIQDVRLGATRYLEQQHRWPPVPAGHVVFNRNSYTISSTLYQIWCQPIQKRVNGTWYTVAQA